MKNDIIKFLLGEESFDGVWFGEKHPTEQGDFWWRKHLSQFINENQALRIYYVVGQSERLVCDACGCSRYLTQIKCCECGDTIKTL